METNLAFSRKDWGVGGFEDVRPMARDGFGGVVER
jgi:hypothetical protein